MLFGQAERAVSYALKKALIFEFSFIDFIEILDT